MKFIDEYRQGDIARKLAEQIARLTTRPLKIMEVCGGHTHAIFKYGIEDLLPENITMIHGPGCPVCVIPLGRVDDSISIALEPNVTFTTFGDMMRVPGSKTNLLDAKARGADVRMVYSPLDALKIAKKNPDRQVVFLALGFETTAPSTAMTILQAVKDGVENFSIFCNHITIVPALKAMLDSPDLQLDGFVGPGHVSTVIGTRPYEFVPREYGKPVAVSGFEPLDVLQSVYMVVKQVVEGRAEVENQYGRCVSRDGNRKALEAIFEVFEPRDYFVVEGETVECGIPFDMFGAEFTHQCDDCTFETLIKKFGLIEDSGLREIAEIIHDVDQKDDMFNRREASGLNATVLGLSELLRDDRKLLRQCEMIFDGLYTLLGETAQKSNRMKNGSKQQPGGRSRRGRKPAGHK